ncbi:MAG: hypothetical protein RPR40_03880 [Bermanella sp.]
MLDKADDRWFPYNARSVGDYFQRLRKECASWLFEKNGLGAERWDVPRVALVTGHQNWN